MATGVTRQSRGPPEAKKDCAVSHVKKSIRHKGYGPRDSQQGERGDANENCRTGLHLEAMTPRYSAPAPGQNERNRFEVRVEERRT